MLGSGFNNQTFFNKVEVKKLIVQSLKRDWATKIVYIASKYV